MASHHFDQKSGHMVENAPGEKTDANTSFLILRDGKVIFDGVAPELAHTTDEYIKDYIS
jgi:hypothetical protein